EANDTLETAQNLETAPWGLRFDANVGDFVSNTSQLIPHVTVFGAGNNTHDYYRFTAPTAGVRGYFDIDAANYDAYLRLYKVNANSTFTLVATADDSSTSWGQGGSTSYLDSFLSYVFDTAGDYVLDVGAYPFGNPVPTGATYQLQLSIEGHPLVIDPASIGL